MTEADEPPEDTIGDNNNFTPEDNKRWDELNAIEEERERNRQNLEGARQLEWSDEQKFAPYFAAANKKIDRLESIDRQKKDGIDTELKTSIKKVVQKLADDLKAQGFRVDGIASEIIHQLKGKGRSWIHEILPDEYKNKTYQENARKRWKRKAEQSEGQQTDKIAPVPV